MRFRSKESPDAGAAHFFGERAHPGVWRQNCDKTSKTFLAACTISSVVWRRPATNIHNAQRKGVFRLIPCALCHIIAGVISYQLFYFSFVVRFCWWVHTVPGKLRCGQLFLQITLVSNARAKCGCMNSTPRASKRLHNHYTNYQLVKRIVWDQPVSAISVAHYFDSDPIFCARAVSIFRTTIDCSGCGARSNSISGAAQFKSLGLRRVCGIQWYEKSGWTSVRISNIKIKIKFTNLDLLVAKNDASLLLISGKKSSSRNTWTSAKKMCSVMCRWEKPNNIPKQWFIYEFSGPNRE